MTHDLNLARVGHANSLDLGDRDSILFESHLMQVINSGGVSVGAVVAVVMIEDGTMLARVSSQCRDKRSASNGKFEAGRVSHSADGCG